MWRLEEVTPTIACFPAATLFYEQEGRPSRGEQIRERKKEGAWRRWRDKSGWSVRGEEDEIRKRAERCRREESKDTR